MSTSLANYQWTDFLVRKLDPYAFAKYEILLGWMGSVQDKEILVIGSGSGEFAAMLAQRGAKVTAVDISEEYIELTRQTAHQFGVSVKAVVSSIENFQAKELYDVVVTTDVLEHLADDDLACQIMDRALKPSGQIVITVPALPFLFGYHDEILGHYRRYSKSKLIHLVQKYFTIARWQYYGFLLIPVAFLVSKMLRRPYPVRAVGQASRGRFTGIINLFFKWEKFISPPIGTSLILVARKKALLSE